MVIKLNCSQASGRVTYRIDGWIEGERSELAKLFFKVGGIDLSDLDPRLEGRVGLTEFASNSVRCPVVVSSEPIIQGRNMIPGEQVRVVIGGPIIWE